MYASSPVIYYNGQPLSAEDLHNIIQQRNEQEKMIRQMQENNNQLATNCRTLWIQNEYHRKEMERIQQENAKSQNRLIKENHVLWQEREHFRTKSEQLQEQVENLMEINGEVELEQLELSQDIDVSMFLYDPNGSQDLPQIVKVVGWGKKFYATVTGDCASNFEKLDDVTKQNWLEDYKKVKAAQQAQAKRGLIKPVAEIPKNMWKRGTVANDEKEGTGYV